MFRYGFDLYIQKKCSTLDRENSIHLLVKVIYISIVSIVFITIFIEFLIYLSLGYIGIEKWQYLSLMLFIGPIFSILWLLMYYFRAIGEGVFSTLNMEIIFPIVQLLVIYILYQYNFSPYIVLFASFFLPTCLCVALYIFKIRGYLPEYEKITISINLKEILGLVRNGFPYLMVSMSAMALVWVDIFVISFFENNASIGLYSVVTRIGMIMLIPASAATIFFNNKVASCYKNDNLSELKKSFNFMFTALTTLAILMFMLVIFFHVEILLLFGSGFDLASTTLIIFMLAQAINLSTGVFESIFVMSDLKMIFAKLNFYMIILNLILNIPLVYFYGIVGASIATLLSIVMVRLIQYRYIQSEFNINA